VDHYSFLHTIPLPSPSPHPHECCLNQNTSNPTRNGSQHWTGGGGIVVCWNSKVLWHLSQDFWNWLYVWKYPDLTLVLHHVTFLTYFLLPLTTICSLHANMHEVAINDDLHDRNCTEKQSDRWQLIALHRGFNWEFLRAFVLFCFPFLSGCMYLFIYKLRLKLEY
jgi:hypothetical protein